MLCRAHAGSDGNGSAVLVPYHALRDCQDAPQLPAGYFAMVVLALFPPLWQAVMDPRLRAWRERYGRPLTPSQTEPV